MSLVDFLLVYCALCHVAFSVPSLSIAMVASSSAIIFLPTITLHTALSNSAGMPQIPAPLGSSPDAVNDSILWQKFGTFCVCFFAVTCAHTTSIQKKNPYYHINHRPIALADQIYRLFTRTLTSIFLHMGRNNQILHDNQEGFRVERCTSQQLQTHISALEDARLINQDILIDFKNAVGSIDMLDSLPPYKTLIIRKMP